MTKDEYILYQAIVIKKQHKWKGELFLSFGKNRRLWKYLCEKHPMLKFPCGFDPDELLSRACFNLNIGTANTTLKEQYKLSIEFLSNIKDKTAPNSKGYREAINKAIKASRELYSTELRSEL